MIDISKLKPLAKGVLVSEMETGEQMIGKVIILDDDMKERGIRPRWCKVYSTGPEVENLTKGDWILVDHGRWTRGFDGEMDGNKITFRFVDYNDILLKSDQHPNVKTS